MLNSRRTVLLIAASMALSGCRMFLTRWQLGYDLVRTETFVDPVSGDVTKTFYWKYEDGRETTTTTTLPKGEVEQRRGERQEPPARFVEE
jgi:hypothetical protein